MQELLHRFRAAHTQVLGVSVDSLHCHANWARDLGGISFPLLADFEPKGAVGRAYGLYLDGAGVDDRATVLIDSGGTVRHASSVTPAGRRDIGELAALCEALHRDAASPTAPPPEPATPWPDAELFVKDHCGFSRRVRVALDNLRVRDLPVRNASRDPRALEDLRRVSGAEQAPCLVRGGEVLADSEAIVRELAERFAPLP